jgi:hypothetical protein
MKRPEEPAHLYAIGAVVTLASLSLSRALPAIWEVQALGVLLGAGIILRGVVIAIVRKRNAQGS